MVRKKQLIACMVASVLTVSSMHGSLMVLADEFTPDTELPSDEQIDILNRVIKKAREIGVSEECIDFFDRRRKKLVEDENATIRTNNI